MSMESKSRSQLEAELDQLLWGKLITFSHPSKGIIIGRCTSSALWEENGELDVILTVNDRRYQMSYGFFNQTVKVL